MRLHRVCELCGQPAIAIVIDLIVVPSPGPYWPDYKPHSAHTLCAAHDRASIFYIDNTQAADPATPPYWPDCTPRPPA
jgi:hypothetical protein